MLNMPYYTIWPKGLAQIDHSFASVEEAIYEVIQGNELYTELMGLLNQQYHRIKNWNWDLTVPWISTTPNTLDQILVALGRHTAAKRTHFEEGVLYLKEKNPDVFFVTLNKPDKDYSPSTMYHDYAISADHFHRKPQSTTSIQPPTGQRYVNQQNGDHNVIFVRDTRRKVKLPCHFSLQLY